MLTGVVGYLKWHYYTAAQLERYRVTTNKHRTVWALTATVVLSDAFKLAQTPLAFVAPHAKGEWRWPILTLSVHPDTHVLTATLGPPQEKKT